MVHGLEATGKTTIVKSLLDTISVPHAIIRNQECITSRHLLEQTLTTCMEVIERYGDIEIEKTRYTRCENTSALVVQLQRLLRGVEKFVLVFDGIDHQREAPATLLPALARFNEFVRRIVHYFWDKSNQCIQIPQLTIVFIVTLPRERFLHKLGIPHIHFTSYAREEALRIISMAPPEIYTEPVSPADEYNEVARQEDNAWLWGRFCAAVWDSLAKGAARDILSFRSLADKLWRPFVASIVDGTYGTRDFSRLMVAKRALFQGEEQLIDRPVVTRADNANAISQTSKSFLMCWSAFSMLMIDSHPRPAVLC